MFTSDHFTKLLVSKYVKLRETILSEHSKATCNRIIKWVGNSQQRFDKLFSLFLNDEYRVVQRAAWPLSYIAIAHPRLIQKHLPWLIKNLHKTGTHDAVKRNTVRMLEHLSIPERFHGELMSLCFDYISTPKEPVAIKVFSMSVLYNLSNQYPEIKPELKTIIEDRWDQESAAFRARGRKILKNL